MALSRHSILCVALGFSLTTFACGDSGDDKAVSAATGDDASANGSNGSGGGNTSGTTGANGASSTGGNQTGGTTGPGMAGDACTGPGQQCTCSNGMMGIQACTNGVLAECTCSIDLGDAGLPAVAACPATATCRSTMNAITGVPGFCSPAPTDGGMAGPGAGFLPPACMVNEDCGKAGLAGTPCSSIMVFGMTTQRCVQPCNP